MPPESVDVSWVRIISWHAVRTPTRVPDQVVTLCGRTAKGSQVAERPPGPSCESCLRIYARRADG